MIRQVEQSVSGHLSEPRGQMRASVEMDGPVSGAMRPAAILRSVDFPMPFRPSRIRNSPGTARNEGR